MLLEFFDLAKPFRKGTLFLLLLTDQKSRIRDPAVLRQTGLEPTKVLESLVHVAAT